MDVDAYDRADCLRLVHAHEGTEGAEVDQDAFGARMDHHSQQARPNTFRASPLGSRHVHNVALTAAPTTATYLGAPQRTRRGEFGSWSAPARSGYFRRAVLIVGSVRRPLNCVGHSAHVTGACGLDDVSKENGHGA